MHSPLCYRSNITDRAKREFQTHSDAEQALKAQLIAACPHIFIRALYDEYLWYGNLSNLDLLTHL